jgi:hypothetical protein
MPLQRKVFRKHMESVLLIVAAHVGRRKGKIRCCRKTPR